MNLRRAQRAAPRKTARAGVIYMVPGSMLKPYSALRPLILAGFLLAAAGPNLIACSGKKGGAPSPKEAFERFEKNGAPDENDEIVARVGSREISQAELDWALEEHALGPDELDQAELLEQLIERELLVEEAIKRGYLERAELKNVQKRAAVRQMLAERIEKPADAEAQESSPEDLEEALQSARARAGHPPGLQASHLLVSVPFEGDIWESASKEEREAWRVSAQRLVDQLREDLPPAPVARELFEVRDAYKERTPEPLEIHVNAHLVFPIGAYLQPDEQPEGGFGQNMPQHWRSVVDEFGRAAVQMARDGRLGELSDPVETQFGVHLILAEKAIPGEVGAPEDIDALARYELARRLRNERLTEKMRDWVSSADTELYPEVIAEAEQAEQ